MKMPVEVPITGRESPVDPREPLGAVAEFYKAFNRRDSVLVAENWDTAHDVVMDNPLGGITRGWNELSKVYARLFEGEAKVYVEFHDYTLHQFADIFYVIGRERGALTSTTGSLELKIRTSRVFRKADGRWKQTHHHGSMDDPGMLAKYQQLVAAKTDA
jgi:ketosteroid isomerase-like protein